MSALNPYAILVNTNIPTNDNRLFGLLDDADTPILLSGGYGGYATTTMQGRDPLTEYDGRDLFQLALPLLFYGGENLLTSTMTAPSSCEAKIAALNTMSIVDAVSGKKPIIRLDSNAIPVEASRITDWVVQDIAWGAYTRDEFSGDRVQQSVTVTLLEYAQAPLTLQAAAAQLAVAKTTKRPAYRKVRVLAGDTVAKLAVRYARKGSTTQQLKLFEHGIRVHNNLAAGSQPKAGTTILVPPL